MTCVTPVSNYEFWLLRIPRSEDLNCYNFTWHFLPTYKQNYPRVLSA